MGTKIEQDVLQGNIKKYKAKVAFKVAGLNQATSLGPMIALPAAPTPKAMTAGISQALLPHKVDALCVTI